MRQVLRACGNPRCGASTGIHEGLTFGSGKLDENGYWEHPCDPCARAWDAKQEATQQRMMQELHCDLKYLEHNYEWLFIEGWPFKKED